MCHYNTKYLDTLNLILSTNNDIAKIILAYSHPYIDAILYELFVELYGQILCLNRWTYFDSKDNFKSVRDPLVNDHMEIIHINYYKIIDYMDIQRYTKYEYYNGITHDIIKIEKKSIIRSKLLILIINDEHINTTSSNLTIHLKNFITFKYIRR